jgi:DNA modification methylase
MPEAVWWTGDARDGIADLGPDIIGAVVTSPPYWSKSGYGIADGELGVGDLDSYVSDLVSILSPLKTVLVPEGSLWLNLGDTASKSGGSGGDYNEGGSRNGRVAYRQGRSGLDGSQWCDVPGQVVRGLQEDGWMLRAHIVWNKMRAKRESLVHARRPGSCWESIFFMVPARFNQDKLSYVFDHTKMTEPGNVWSFPPRHHPVHPAVFPPELPRRCLEPLAGLVDIGPVLDPFAGVGTTVGVALEMGFNAIGFDLDPKNEQWALHAIPSLEFA